MPKLPHKSPGPSLITPRPHPRDLLKLTATPIHPFDHIHHVDTSGLVPARHLRTGHPSDEHVTAYYGVAPSILTGLVERWRETLPPYPISAYTFVDIGAGKGRALLVASELHFRRVVGVELNPALAAIARHNIARWTADHHADPTAPRIAPIELLEQDALDLTLPATPILIFLFHPFDAPVLERFVDNIAAQFAASSKRSSRAGGKTPALDILYVNAECAAVLDRNPHLTRLFLGSVPMSPEDHAADREAIAQQKDYGSTGDEECAIYRWIK